MHLRQHNSAAASAAKAGFGTATGYRIEQDPRPPSVRRKPRARRRPDPLAGIFERGGRANSRLCSESRRWSNNKERRSAMATANVAESRKERKRELAAAKKEIRSAVARKLAREG